MTISVIEICALLGLLQLKHVLADFFLQTPVMLADRARVLHLGRVLHCLVHGAGTAIALLVMGTGAGLLAGLVLLDAALHYLIDMTKGVWSEKSGEISGSAGYWRAFGLDQAAHQLTYLLLALIWAQAL